MPRSTELNRQRMVRWWSARLMGILQIRVQVQGIPPGLDVHNAMLVANHVSWLDIYLLNSVRPARFVSKSDVRQWPVIGWVAWKTGTFFINRAKRHDTARVNHEMSDALSKGACVAVFPEGTTSHGDALLPFHASLFQPAIHSESKVWPVALRYRHADGSLNREVSYVGETSFGESVKQILGQAEIHAELVYAPPIPSHGKTRRELARLAEQAIAEALDLAPENDETVTATEQADAVGTPELAAV
ncbi:MAG TPA: lysophospholipid acyltransferase family protein [Gallionellaceae bacterium]|nr:lysophospholipid acyltransferase family protein [Gallionellaceae bacterium]